MLVIADDFTSANDTGVLFIKNNAVVDIVLDWRKPIAVQSDVIVVNTDSRAVAIAEAALRIRTVLSLYHIENKRIYKRLIPRCEEVSIGTELESLLVNTENRIIFFCAALPSAGRTVRDGICYVNDVPLLQTEFATDPKTPICSSNVREIIKPVIEIHSAKLHSHSMLSEINHISNQHHKCIFAFDARTERDLAVIAQLGVSDSLNTSILVGSSSLAAYLPKQYYLQDSQIESERALPILFVVGSMSEKTNEQVQRLVCRREVVSVNIKVERLFTEDFVKQREIRSILTALQAGRDVVLKTESDITARKKIDALCERYGLSRAALGEKVCANLSAAVAKILQGVELRIATLFLTGGDIAIGVANVLNAVRYRVVDEIEQGVPVGYFADSRLSHIPVITKAGAFGSPNVLEKIIDFVRN